MRERREVFNKSIQTRPISYLQDILRSSLLPVSRDHSREDCIDRLQRGAPDRVRRQELQTRLLSGRFSMSVFEFDFEEYEANPGIPAPNFDGAVKTPSIVMVGEEGAILDGQCYVMWAVSAGEANYIDTDLVFRAEGKAQLIHSFYDPVNQLLQVRTNARLANKIVDQWTQLLGVHYEDCGRRLGITTIDQCHAFTDQLGGRVKACNGEARIINGFGQMKAKAHESVTELRGTDDFTNWTANYDAIDEDVEFEFDDTTYKIGISLQSETIVFQTKVTESVVEYVRAQLIEFFENEEEDDD